MRDRKFIDVYTVCLKKNIPDIFSCNSRKHCRTFIIFGTHVTEQSADAIVSHHTYLVLLRYLRKCSSSKIASFHSNAISLLCQF